MAIKLKRSYRFAFRSSLLITLFFILVIAILSYFFVLDTWVYLAFVACILFLGSFIILQVRIERFIYRRVKQIYDDVALLESSSLVSGPITTDMKTLTEEIEKFAKDKKVEIDTLKIREEYRKDFLGNVSHELKT
ncbi:MAG: sensor histidine kinase, partial [Pricia sp.]|nr:sensor histidine kinase [Pricia sp.]